MAYGYLLSKRDCQVIALHDCDIVNYDRQLLARLCYAVAHPLLSFDFCKGYYARVTDRMHGRVTRLFMAPLIRALEGMAPGNPYLRFLDSFRFPLAGEFAMDIDLARVNRIPGDWGLEVGVLAEIFRNCATARTCQVDLMDNYEHKHQALSTEDPAKGLSRMAADIAKSIFSTLAAEGLVFTADHFHSLEVRYVRMAQDTIARYYADALLNGLKFDRHAEELAVAVFARSLSAAAAEFVSNPRGLTLIPNWNRVLAALPEFFELLQDAVEKDARQLSVRTA
jgi:glucosyl-3-phosphoglycerate synthase